MSGVVGAVETLEEAAVEEGDVGEKGEGLLLGDGEEALVAVEVVDVVGGAVFLEAFVGGEEAVGIAFGVLAHALVEGGEEEVLEDGLVISGAGLALGVEAIEDFSEVGGVEEFLGDKAVFFFEEPAEDQPGEEADEAGGAAFFRVGLQVGGEIDLRECPEIPVGEFFVEAGVEELDVEDLIPSGVEGVEVLDGEFFRVD